MTYLWSVLLGLVCVGVCAEPNRAADNPVNAVPQYQLAIKIIPAAHRLEIKGELVLPPSSAARSSLELHLSSALHDLEVAVLAPQAGAGATRFVKETTIDDVVTWSLQPSKPFPAGEPIRLQFSYAGGDEIRPLFYIGKEGSFASSFETAWDPMAGAYDRCTAKMVFLVPRKHSVIANGRRVSGPQEEERGEFSFEVIQPSHLTFAAARYRIERRKDAQGNTIAAYLLKRRPGIGEYLEKCAQVKAALTQEFGPSPWRDLAVVETPAKPSRKAGLLGAAAEGLILVLGPFLDGDFNTAFYGHELSHQWWGVSVNGKPGPRGLFMLDEAMAQYGSLRAVEMVEGPDVAESYRRTGYPGYVHAGYVPDASAQAYLKTEARSMDQPLSALQPDSYGRQLADTKGFLVLDLLSRTVGREVFRRILQDVASRYAGNEISWDEFLEEVQKGSGANLTWFYQQWFEREGVPQWGVTWRQAGNLVFGAIRQPPPYFRAEVDVLLEGEDGQNWVETVELHAESTVFVLPAGFKVRAVTVDPRFLVPHRPPSVQPGRP